ncbi:carbohydrate binding domain-containing protein [Flavitalea flava]
MKKSGTRVRITCTATLIVFSGLLLLQCLLLPGEACSQSPTYFYVSPSGNDSNPGSLSQPFLSLEKARTAVRAINTSMTGNIYVYLRGGNYQLDSTLKFDEGDSGSGGYDVIYSAYPGETPAISGGKPITGWTLVSGNLWKATVSGVNEKIRQLYVNGIRAGMATGPTVLTKGGYGAYTGLPNGFLLDSCSVSGNYKDVEVNIKHQYVDFYLGVDTIIASGPKKAVLMQQPFFSYAQRLEGWAAINFDSTGSGFQQYVTLANASVFLGQPGEFYYDRAMSTIYYTPREGEVMATAETIIPNLSSLIQIKGSSLTHKASHIQFTGIQFMHTKYLLEKIGNSVGYFVGQGDCPFVTMTVAQPWCSWGATTFSEIKQPPAGINVDNADHIRFEKNTITHMGSLGISFRNGVSNSRIDGNVIRDIASAGINIGSPQHGFNGDGVREAESARNNVGTFTDANASGGRAVNGLTAIGDSIQFDSVKNYTASYQPLSIIKYSAINTGTLSLYVDDTFRQRINFYPTVGSQPYNITSSDMGNPWFIRNFNFEFGDSAWTKSGVNAIIADDSAGALTGRRYARITGSGWVDQLITSGFTPGNYFDLTGRGKLTGTPASGASIGVKCYNGPTLVSDTMLKFQTARAYYKYQSFRFQVPGNTTVLEVYVYNGDNNTTFSADELFLSDAGNGSYGSYLPGPGWAPTANKLSKIKLKRDSADVGGPIIIDHIGGGEFTYGNEEICKRDTVDNNYIRENSFNFRSSPVIMAHFSDSLHIDHNDIDHTPYTGISEGWGWNWPLTPLSGNNTIGYNSIQHVMETQYDGGGIYTLGQQPNSKMLNNYIYGVNEQYGGLYFDAGSQGFSIFLNVVENVHANVPWLRLNYYAYINQADSNFRDNGTNNTEFLYDNLYSTVTHTSTYSPGSRTARAQSIVDSAGLQDSYSSIIPTSQPYEKLLANPGFESGSAFWTNLGNAGVQNSAANSGSNGISITGAGGFNQIINSGFTIGNTYTISGFGKMSNTAGKGVIGIKCRNAADSVLLEEDLSFTTETSYVQKNASFIPPAGTVKIEVFAWDTNSSAVFSADDLQLSGTVQLAANPGFEEGKAGWTNLGNALIQNNPANANAGNYKVVVTGTGGFNQTLTTGFVIGHTYHIKGLARMSNTGGTGFIGVKCHNSSGTVLLERNVQYNTETTYVEKDTSFVLPSGTTTLEIYVWNANNNALLYADDLLVTDQTVSNPGLESAGNSWINLGNAVIQNNSGNANTGSYSILTSGNGGYNQIIRSGFIAGRHYTLSGFGKMSGSIGSGNGHIGVKCWSAGNSLLLQTDLVYSTETTYTQKKAGFVIPSNCAYLEVYVWNDNASAVIRADDIELR